MERLSLTKKIARGSAVIVLTTLGISYYKSISNTNLDCNWETIQKVEQSFICTNEEKEKIHIFIPNIDGGIRRTFEGKIVRIKDGKIQIISSDPEHKYVTLLSSVDISNGNLEQLIKDGPEKGLQIVSP